MASRASLINQTPSLADVLARVTPETPEQALPLYARGGLMGVYGFGPNPARERIEQLRKERDEQR